jgi:hypothetical protein
VYGVGCWVTSTPTKYRMLRLMKFESSYATTECERQDRTRVFRILQINALCLWVISVVNIFFDQEVVTVVLSVVVRLVNQPEHLPYDVGKPPRCPVWQRKRLSRSRTSVIIIPNPDVWMKYDTLPRGQILLIIIC